jgi:hypothetical protein
VSSFWDGTCSCDTLTLTALKRPKLLFPVLITPRQQQAVIVGLGFQLPILPVSLAKMPIRSDIKLRSWVLIVPGIYEPSKIFAFSKIKGSETCTRQCLQEL